MKVAYYWLAVMVLAIPMHLGASEALQVRLQVGSERAFVWSSVPSIKVGIPPSLRNKLSATTIASQVWLLAQQPFANEKIIFRAADRQVVLVLSAAADYPAGDTVFLDPLIANAASKAWPPPQTVTARGCNIGMVALARHALQWAYAPRRLLKDNPCISATAYRKGRVHIMNCLHNAAPTCGGGVVAQPIAAWRAAHLYASLLELQNTLETAVVLDPRALGGDFKAAAYAHHRLGAAGTAHSLTALLVISDRPLGLAIPQERWLNDTPAAKPPNNFGMRP